MNSNSFNMFGKHRTISSSSDNTQNKKNLNLYDLRDRSKYNSVIDDMVVYSSNYKERYNMYKGFVECKKKLAEKSATNTNEPCFNIYLDSNVDIMNKVNLEDWSVANVDYDFLTDQSILLNHNFPYLENSNNLSDKTIPEQYTYFNDQNNLNKSKYVRNFKYGHSMSNLK